MRYRVTVRGTDLELQGHIENQEKLFEFCQALVSGMKDPLDPLVIASPAEDDPFSDPGAQDFLREAGEKLPELIGDSALSVMLIGETPDPKFCIELGYSIMYEKPMILVVRNGAKIPSKIVKIADEIVEWDGGSVENTGLNLAIERVIAKLS